MTDADLEMDAFLPLLGRVVDTGKILGFEVPKDAAPEFQEAIRARNVVVGMTYQMVLTKADAVKPAALARKAAEVAALAKQHPAAHMETVVTSSESGLGIAELRGALSELAAP